MVRIARDFLVVAVPAGRASEEQDRRLDAAYLRPDGTRFAFLIEHVDNGLPTQEDLDAYLHATVATDGRTATIPYA